MQEHLDGPGWQSATHLLASLVGADLEATVVNHNILLSSFVLKLQHVQHL